MKFVYLVFKHFPINMGSTHEGIIEAKSVIGARKKLEKTFRQVQIIRRID